MMIIIIIVADQNLATRDQKSELSENTKPLTHYQHNVRLYDTR